MLFQRMAMILAIGMLLSQVCRSQKSKTDIVRKDTVRKEITVLGNPKPYKELITEKAITDEGLFKIHKLEERFYFEIPNSLLEKDILIINRIAKAASDIKPAQSFLGYAGDLIGQNVIRFSRGPGNKIYINRISFREQSKDSSGNGLYRSVLNSNLQPIVASFDIKSFSIDSSGFVIDLTDYLNGDNDVFFFGSAPKSILGLTALQADKSYINKIRSFSVNIEISTVKTYSNPALGFATYELNSSVILLPEKPMTPRYHNLKVGYFPVTYVDYDANPQKVEFRAMIARWRLEPKKEDIEKYKRGELVEPQKSIVFYIDPTTPKRWISYLIQGVNDWQVAFEKAGFRNAIYALEAAINDSSWSLEDARHSAIVYKPSQIQNASGPNINDPRSGEILESHIDWYHNLMQLLHDWYFIQASPVDIRARNIEFDDSLMGELIRFVCSHEVGHTLGLMHNFGASSTIPVDSLRSKKYVEANGFCPSIMDYARFNYVAQPEDSISPKGIFPRIGDYDKWAIEWGYRWFPDNKTVDEEQSYLNAWATDVISKDKRLWYGSEISGDPRCQSEDLGDNAMKASYYGINNLKRIIPNLRAWAKEKKSYKGYESLNRIYKGITEQYQRYLFHVVNNVGAIMTTHKTTDQPGTIFQFRDRETQRAAIRFLQEQLFTTPKWLMDTTVFDLTLMGGPLMPLFYQQQVLGRLLSLNTFSSMVFSEGRNPGESYTPTQFLSDLETGIWSELKNLKPIDVHRRMLQKAYAIQLANLLNPPRRNLLEIAEYTQYKKTDIIPIIKNDVKNLVIRITAVLPGYKDKITKLHLEEIRTILKEAIALAVSKSDSNSGEPNLTNDESVNQFSIILPNIIMTNRVASLHSGCWDNIIYK